MSTPSTALRDLDPIELLILAFLATAQALITLVDAATRLRKQPTPPAPVAPARPQPLARAATRASQAVAPPAVDSLNVQQLRTLARVTLGPSARLGGRRIAQARRADLLSALA